MGLSRLLRPQTTFHFRTLSYCKQTPPHFSTSSSAPKNETAKARKTEAVETYVRKFIEMHPGSFPKPSHVHKEVGGSWYTLKELLQNVKQMIFGNTEVQNNSSNNATSTSAADAADSTTMTTRENSCETPDHSEHSNSLTNALCQGSNIPPSAMPYTNGNVSSNMMGDTVLDAKETCNDLENAGPCEVRNSNSVQSSAEMNSYSEDHIVRWEISNVTEEHCSEVVVDATASVGVFESPHKAGISEAASNVKVEGISINPEQYQQKKHAQHKEVHKAVRKSNKLSSLIYEAIGTWQETDEDKMASTSCKNQAESNIYVDRFSTKISESPAAEGKNGHLQPEEKPSRVLVSSNAEITATLLEVVPSTYASAGNGLEQKENQQKVCPTLPDKVFKEGGMPELGNGERKLTELAALFSKVDDQKSGQIRNKDNIVETDVCMKNLDKISRVMSVNDLIDCIKGSPTVQQVASEPRSVISDKTDFDHHSDHIRLLSQSDMQKLDEGQQISSSHSFDRKIEEDPSVKAPIKIESKNGKDENQEKGNADSVVLDANKSIPDPCIPQTLTKHSDNAQDPCSESLDQNKITVTFLLRKAEQEDIVIAFKKFGEIVKTEISKAGQRYFKTATVYFRTRKGMHKALQTTDLTVKGGIVTMVTASSPESQSKNITIPCLIGDPDVPAALVKNPMRTVAIKHLTRKICPKHIEKALAFCESKISGIFLGSSHSVAYVEFETEDGKDRALAKQSIVISGAHLSIFRIDAPRTTVVRIKSTSAVNVSNNMALFKSLGNVRACRSRHPNILDVHFSITEWPNMLTILNKLNGMEVDGSKFIAEPAPIVPPNMLLQLYSEPEERKRIKDSILKLYKRLHDVHLVNEDVLQYYSE